MKAAISSVLMCGLIALVGADNITRHDFKEMVVGVPKDRGVVAQFLKNIGPVLQSTVRCPDGGLCNDGNSCCLRTNGVYGCCPFAAPSLCCPMNTCCKAAGNACCPEGGCCAIGSTCCGTVCCLNQGVCCGNNGCCMKGYRCCTLSTGVAGCCLSGGSSTTIRSILHAWCLLLMTVFILV